MSTVDEWAVRFERDYALHRAFDHFNDTLFDAALPDCPVFFSRKVDFGGFFPARRAEGRPDTNADTPVILMNPDKLGEPPAFVMSVLVHEQCHLWRGIQGPRVHLAHDARWASKMVEVGLMPSQTGRPGGRQAGHRMSHYILPDGRFERAFRAMPPASLHPWRLRVFDPAPRR